MLRGSERFMAGETGEGTPQTGQTVSKPVGLTVKKESLCALSDMIALAAPESPSPTLAAEVGGGGEDRGRVTETQRAPELEMGHEGDITPERGRWLTLEYVRYKNTMLYEVRYNAENGPNYKQICDEIQAYVNHISKIRNDRDPYSLKKVYEEIEKAQRDNVAAVDVSPKERKRLLKLIIEQQSGQPATQEEAVPSPSSLRLAVTKQGGVRSKEDHAYLSSLTKEQHQQIITELNILDLDERGTVADEDAPKIEEKLLTYFREAHRKGILQGVDEILLSFYHENVLTSEMSTSQTIAHLEQEIRRASKDIEGYWKVNRSDPEVSALRGIWVPYLRWAEARLISAIHNRAHPDAREGEFRLEREGGEVLENSQETYWEPGSWAGYYIIKAKTPEEFRRAAETFFYLIRRGSIGKSPEDVFKHLQNFKEAFGAKGSLEVSRRRKDQKPGKLTDNFMKELRLEFEAKSYAFLADYSIENYNPQTWHQAMTTMALHEGPARWTRLYRAGQGVVAAFTDLFDYNKLMEVFVNPVGDRGELDIIAQHFIQDQVKEIAIEQGLGIRLKDYDLREASTNLANYIKYKDQDISQLPSILRLSITLGRVQSELQAGKTVDQLSEDDQKLYVTSVADLCSPAHLKTNLERLGLHMSHEQLEDLYEGMNGVGAHVRNFLNFGNLNSELLSQLSLGLRQSINLGRVQLLLNALPNQVSLVQRMKRDEVIDELTPEDQRAYMEAYENAEANFDIAFQMQGASGEKVRKGRGFFYVDRNPQIQAYLAVVERSEKIKYILRELKNHEDTKDKKLSDKKGKELKNFSPEVQEFYNGLSKEEKTPTAQGLYGIGSEYLKEQRESIQIGWMMSEMRSMQEVPGRQKLDSFTPAEQALYNSIPPQERSVIVDHLPVYQAEMFVQTGVTLTKIKYADDAPVWNERERGGWKTWTDPIAQAIRKENKDAKPPKNELENFKAQYRAKVAAKVRDGAITDLRNKGLDAVLHDEYRNVMEIKTPKLKLNQDGSIYRDSETGKPITERVDLVNVTFQVAIDPKNIYNRYTTHTYWGYQGENRHMVLREDLFKAAENIRDGLSRPEDEDIMASQLLIIDPTLCRVAKFDTDQIEREITLFQAAVEESYLSHVYINKGLFKSFLSESGNRSRMRAGYNMEDWGGTTRFSMGLRELASTQVTRFARRGVPLIAITPIYIDSMSAIWGQNGVSGAIEMFADNIKDIAHQGIVGQFGIIKFIEQVNTANVELFNALIGWVKEKQHIEGLYMKPTNNNEFQHKWDDVTNILSDSKAQLEFMQNLKETLGRLEVVLKIMRTMYSDGRNSGGALRLENVDIFLENGRYNPVIEADSEIYMDTGTSRHLEKDFFDDFCSWLLSEMPGGGGQIYPDELEWNKYLSNHLMIRVKEGKRIISMTLKEWFFSKAGL